MPLGDGFHLKPLDAVLDEIDNDIRQAVADRTVAFRKLFVRDDKANRDACAEAEEYLNHLLEMRLDMVRAEGVVTG